MAPPTVEDLTAHTADVLEGAAECLETDGWCQRHSTLPTGQRCVVGAITRSAVTCRNLAAPNFGSSGAALHVLRDYLGLRQVELVAKWNDRPDRTEYEVIDALKGAAKALRNGEQTLQRFSLIL